MKKIIIRSVDVKATIEERLRLNRLVIVEGSYCLDMLQELNLIPDFFIEMVSKTPRPRYANYRERHSPSFEKVDAIIKAYQ